MVRYIKDGAYTIIVEDSVDSNETGDAIISGGTAEESCTVSAKEKTSVVEDEVLKEIDFQSKDFILQNLQLATPDYSVDKTCMLLGRKDLIEIICSQVCFYCYCALLGLENKPSSISILIIGDGFVGTNVVSSLINRGCGHMLRVFTRSDTRAAEWCAKDIKSDCSVMQLLAGQRPDIIIPCVENASFTSLCKQLTEQSIITDASFVITPTFGFQRRKLLNNLKCSSIFRTYVEPQQIVRRYKTSSIARRMKMMTMLALTGQSVPAVVEEERRESPQATAGAGKTRDSKLLKSVLWGGDIDDSGTLGSASFFVRNAMESVQEGGVETTESTVVNGVDMPMSFHEEGAVLLRERIRRMISLVQLLENYYFIHGMMHHEARMTAMSVIFGYHEVPTGSIVSQPLAAVVTADSLCSASGILHPLATVDDVSVSSTVGSGRTTPSLASHPPSRQAIQQQQHTAAAGDNSSLISSCVGSSVTHDLHHTVAVPQRTTNLYHHLHHIYTFNAMRRSKVPNRVRLALEQAIDNMYAGGCAEYQAEFGKGLAESSLSEMLHHYPPNHQYLLDQQSFLANHAAAPIRSAVNTPGGGVRHVAKHDKHKPYMYEEDEIVRIYAEDDDYAHMTGEGFDFMRQMDTTNTPRVPRQASSVLELAEEAKKEEIASLVKLLEAAKERASSPSNAPPISGATRGPSGSVGATDDDSTGPDSMGKRMFRKHSLFTKDMHSKLASDVIRKNSNGDELDGDFTQILSHKASFAMKKRPV